MARILGVIFGSCTILQNTISRIHSNACFITVRNDIDEYQNDGYVLSAQHQSEIDACIKNSPDMIFMKDCSNEPRTALSYCTTLNMRSHGCSPTFRFQSLTSVMLYLIEQGAGIQSSESTLSFMNLTSIRPQLFVGMKRESTYFSGENNHIFTHKDLKRLYCENHLSYNDLLRLDKQAGNGLLHGGFNSTIQHELAYIRNTVRGFLTELDAQTETSSAPAEPAPIFHLGRKQ